MNLGIIVEGPTDQKAYPILIQKIRNDAYLVHPPISCDSVQRLKTRFVGFLKHFNSRRDLQLHKVFVVRDSDCRQPTIVENELLQILLTSRLQPYFSVHFHATKCALETLLLADVNAIKQAAIRRGHPGRVQPLSIRLEECKEPKPLFRKRLSEAGLRVTPEVYAGVASQADTQAIAQNCPYFRQFIAKIHAC